MVDFSKLLKAPAGAAKAPKALPVGDYHGIIKRWNIVEAPQGKDYSSMIRFQLGLTGWPDDIDEEDKLQETAHGQEPLDLSKRQLSKDFYDHRLDLFDLFLRELGLSIEGRTYEEVLPETVGCQVIVAVRQYINQRTGETGNQVDTVKGLES